VLHQWPSVVFAVRPPRNIMASTVKRVSMLGGGVDG
jgi:hypothetical protein